MELDFSTCFDLDLAGSDQNDKQLKRYDVASAKITYKISSLKGTGTKVLLFDQYGKRESVHERLTKNGKVVEDQLTLIKNGKLYSVDLLSGTGRDMSSAMQMAGMGDGNMMTKDKKMLQSMGSKQVGFQSFMGKNCEHWEMNAMGKINFLFWKGVPMKMESKIMSTKSVEEATAIQTGPHFSDTDFALPKGVKIEAEEGFLGAGMENALSPKVLKHYVTFNGGARRTEYWMFVLFNAIFLVAASILDYYFRTYFGLAAIYALLTLVPSLAVAVRRLHDTGKSGWMILVVLIPVVGAVWLLILMLTEGVTGNNHYGSNPKEVTILT